jgi:DNA-binding winged helix-turn-helix (wHTH) protein
MSTDADPLAHVRPKRLCFGRYVLDLARGCLFLDGNEVALRPKTFAVLQYLIENSGRLVSKDELFAAVWPNLAVTDDALVQSIGELRRALGDDGPRLIRTVPRRGYRFESAVSVVAPADPSVIDGATVSAASPDGAQSPVAIAARTSTSPALTHWPRALFAALALVALLVVGVLLANRGSLRFGDQLTRSPKVDTRAAIAVLPS